MDKIIHKLKLNEHLDNTLHLLNKMHEIIDKNEKQPESDTPIVAV